jgi:DNA-binding Lrp family transcriptional regulator
MRVYTVYGDQDEIARELGMTRQALAIHLKRLKELGLVRTGREFVDITEKAVKLLKGQSNDVIILVKIEPKYRDKVYEATKKLPIEKALRLAGDYDLAIITQETVLDKVLDAINNMEGEANRSTVPATKPPTPESSTHACLHSVWRSRRNCKRAGYD